MDEKIRLFSMFSGYGGAEFALQKAGVNYEVVGYSEIDKYAIQCYEQNHSKVKNYGDCTKINPNDIPDFDLLTGGFPCQAFSNAGKRLGELDTRGTLVYDIVRIAEVKQPKWIVLENVKGFTFKKFKDTFDKVLSEFDRIGYNIKYQVLNTKDYGVPQHRERVIFVMYRKDLEYTFEFPEKQELKLSWRDLKDDEINYKKVKKTPSRDIMREKCKNITTEDIVSCISLKQDRFPNAGIIDFEDYYRFLTPIEVFRLQGFLNNEINLENLSDTQKYKLAGNGWSINVFEQVFRNMFKK